MRYKDLPDQTGQPFPRAFLFCPECQGEWSAHRGDYFMARPDAVVVYCHRPMTLVTRQSRLVPVGEATEG